MAYGLATLNVGGAEVAALRVADKYWPIGPSATALGMALPDRVTAIIDAWDASESALDRIAEAAAEGDLDVPGVIDESSATLLAPLRHPRKLIAIGANYGDHVAKVLPVIEAMGYEKPDSPPDRPAYFMKPPSTTMVAPGEQVRIPNDCRQFDWEIELAAVVGRRISHVEPDEGLAAIMGYTIAIDFSARDFQIVPKSLFKFDLFAGKAFDTSCPVGPVVIPARFFEDPQDTRMLLTVNGETKQDSSTARMTYPIGAVISELSKILTLEPGDLVLTGTPDGTGIETGEFLSPGDRVSASIDPIGVLNVMISR